MNKQIFIAIRILGVMILLFGVIYPLTITGIGQLIFPNKANGSLIIENGKIIGSKLIGQKIDKDIYFQSRPSAVKYQTLPSGASNLGLTSKKLYETVLERKTTFLKENNLSDKTIIPSEILFASGSGLDPHISPEAAYLQINRIAEKRGFTSEQKSKLSKLVEDITEKPQLGFLGCSRVNVLQLNIELDKLR